VAVDAAARHMHSRLALVTGALDVPLVVIAAIVAIAAGAPVLGSVIGAGVWLLNRIVAVLDRRWADGVRAARTQVTITLFERFGRIWLLAAGIIVSGLVGGRRDGLTTALFVCGAYTFVFVIRLFSGPPEPGSGS